MRCKYESTEHNIFWQKRNILFDLLGFSIIEQERCWIYFYYILLIMKTRIDFVSLFMIYHLLFVWLS